MAMPEKIWSHLWAEGADGIHGVWDLENKDDATPYIRADLVDELVKALEHARESIEILANMVSDNKQFRQDVSDDLAKIDAALARIDALKEKQP